MKTSDENESLESGVESPHSGGRGGSTNCTSGVGNCRCSRCSLYRWYPPLLVVSTVMAGLFCVLYLTKPTHVVTPQPDDRPDVPVAVPEPERSPEAPVPGYGELAEGSAGGLDPMLGGLPGEAPKVDGFRLATRGPVTQQVVAGVSPEGMQPLKVEGPREGLFRPAPPVAAPVAEEPVKELVISVPEPDLPFEGPTLEVPVPQQSELVIAMGLEEDSSRADALGVVDAGSGSQKRLEVVMGMPSIDLADEEETVVEPPASIIGEFYPRETHRSEPAASFFREESI